VSLNSIARKHRSINPFSVVSHTQTELLIVVAHFNLDLLSSGVPKSVPQRLGNDLVDLVTNDGVQIARLALNCYTEDYYSVAG
jgi:hypothetical protein